MVFLPNWIHSRGWLIQNDQGSVTNGCQCKAQTAFHTPGIRRSILKLSFFQIYTAKPLANNIFQLVLGDTPKTGKELQMLPG